MFEVLNKLDSDFSGFVFGSNKEGDLFINGQHTVINLSRLQEIGIEKSSLEEEHRQLKKFLIDNFPMSETVKEFRESMLKSKFIKVARE